MRILKVYVRLRRGGEAFPLGCTEMVVEEGVALRPSSWRGAIPSQ